MGYKNGHCNRLNLGNYMLNNGLQFNRGVMILVPRLLPFLPKADNMFRITTESRRGKTILSVEGRLVGAGVRTLEQCWREMSAASPKPKFHINLCGVSFIDNTGKVLLKEMHQQGAALIAEGCLNQAIVREITGAKGRPEEDDEEQGGRKPSGIIFYVLLFGLLFGAGFAQAQDPSMPSATPSSNSAIDPMHLTLEQAVSLALKQNPTEQIGLISAAESVQDRNISRSDLLPQA